MLDTQERKAAAQRGGGSNGSDAPESVEALEEALASARLRLQERLTGEIEAKRHELERLEAEYQQRHTETSSMVAQANETAARVIREANEASEQLRREASDAADRIGREATKDAERIMREASEAAELKMHEAAGAAERMLREASENARATMSHAHETASALLARLRDQAGSFMSVAAEEVDRVEKAIAATGTSRGEKRVAESKSSSTKATSQIDPEQGDGAAGSRTASATSETEQPAPAEKEGPSRWIRSALKGRPGGQSGSTELDAPAPVEAEASSADPAPPGDDAHRPVTGATEPAIEAVVTRMVVHPLVGAATRTRIKDRFEALPGIQAIKLGAAGDDSFELLVIHPREAKVLDNVLAIAPDEILLREQKVGYLELELKDMGWVEA